MHAKYDNVVICIEIHYQVRNDVQFAYLQLCTYRGSSTTQLFAEMELYVSNRIFETLFGDLVPLVVANALNSNVIIIHK